MKLITLSATAFICVDACSMDQYYAAHAEFARRQNLRASYDSRAIKVHVVPESKMTTVAQMKERNINANNNVRLEDFIRLAMFPQETFTRAARPAAGKAPASEELVLTPNRKAAVSALSALLASPARQLFATESLDPIVAAPLVATAHAKQKTCTFTLFKKKSNSNSK